MPWNPEFRDPTVVLLYLPFQGMKNPQDQQNRTCSSRGCTQLSILDRALGTSDPMFPAKMISSLFTRSLKIFFPPDMTAWSQVHTPWLKSSFWTHAGWGVPMGVCETSYGVRGSLARRKRGPFPLLNPKESENSWFKAGLPGYYVLRYENRNYIF